MAKMPAARGVPNRPEKPAAMPHIVMVRRSRWLSLNCRPIKLAMEPPICRAAPSLPEEPPVRWVSMEET